MKRDFFLKPGCGVSDFRPGDLVKPYKMGLDTTMTVLEVCSTENKIITDCGSCWRPNDLWPLHYENEGAIYVDFDDTLSKYEGNSGKLGKPKPLVVMYVKHLLEMGYKVKLFTARVSWTNYDPVKLDEWCLNYLGTVLEITNIKFHDCIMIIDDRAFNVREIEKAFGVKHG